MNVTDVLKRAEGTEVHVAYFAAADEASAWLTGPPSKAPISEEAKAKP
jgi:hypothetical protein